MAARMFQVFASPRTYVNLPVSHGCDAAARYKPVAVMFHSGASPEAPRAQRGFMPFVSS